MGKFLKPSSIRRQINREARVKIGGFSGGSDNVTLQLAASLGVARKAADITTEIEKKLVNLGIEIEFEEPKFDIQAKVNDPGLTDLPQIRGNPDFNRLDETPKLPRVQGTSKFTQRNATVIANSFSPRTARAETLTRLGSNPGGQVSRLRQDQPDPPPTEELPPETEGLP